MKNIVLLLLLNVTCASLLYAQHDAPGDSQRKAITHLIDQYSEAREKSDTGLLKNILTTDIDQLVSTGEWRNGMNSAVQGMLKSSANLTGTRTLTVENIRMLSPFIAIVDCRYEIQNTNSSPRKMWSSFIVVAEKKLWKISAIRNMLPAIP